MSRSYRKPWSVCGYGSKYKRFAKNYANRRIRKFKDVPDHTAYKKFSDQWDICDWKSLYDPNPYVMSFCGKLETQEPEPKWKAIRK